MPKRSERQIHAKSFGGNPYEGENPKRMYKRLRWGNEPSMTCEIDAPEPLVALGEVAKIRGVSGTIAEYGEYEGPYLAVGRDSNLLYLIPCFNDGHPYKVPDSNFKLVTRLKGIDYYSDKGGELIYYFHDHEQPYPSLMQHKTGVCYIEPAVLPNGDRSYVVDDAGIIG